MLRTFVLFQLVLLLLAGAGCQQPVTHSQARRPLFDFNRNGLFAQNATREGRVSPFGGPFQNRGSRQVARNEDIPNLDIQPGRLPGESPQAGDLNRQLGLANLDNQELYSQIANLTQRLQVSNDYNQQLKQQLADSASQFQQLQTAKLNADRQMASMQTRVQQAEQFAQQTQARLQTQPVSQRGGAPTQLPGTAVVRANNSLLQKINQVQIAGATPQMDGDVIRIEFPTDSLLVRGTYQVQASRVATLQNLVQTIRQTFPKQIIGVEAHWDGTPLQPSGTTEHQLTATQALSIFNELTRLGLPERQLFIMGLGSNRPKHQDAIRNRRIEVVIYPEEFGVR